MKINRVRDALVQLALQPRNLAKSLSTVMPGASAQGLTVVSLDGQWLKLLHAEGPPRSRKITNAVVCPVQGESAAQIEARLKKACATESITPKDVLLVNPTHLCTVRLFSLPSTDPKEIRDIVDLQAEKHTPYAKDEILTDFTIIDRDRSGYSRVLLIIAHRDVIHRSVRLADASGWMLERVGCELEGLVSWLRGAQKGSEKAPASEASLVIDVDATTTTLLLVQDGRPQFHRSLATGIDQLEHDPQHAGDRLVGEFQRSIEALEAEGSSPKIHHVVLTGSVGRLGTLKAQVEQGLNLPVTLVSPWDGCEVTDSARQAIDGLPDVSFAGLVGLVRDAGEVDLTPQTTKLRQAFEERAKALVLLGCQFLGALILASLLFVGRAQKEFRYYSQLKALYHETARESSRVERAMKQLQFIEGRLRQRGQLLEAVDTLAKESPQEIKWNTLTFTLDELVVLSGTADQLPKVYEFSGSVSGSPLFDETEVRRVAKRTTENEQDVHDFELRCPLQVEEVEL